MQDYQQYCHPGTHCSEQMLPVNERVSLRMLSFLPASGPGNAPIVMVAGLSSVIESFKDVLVEITKDFPVYYIETREKSSSKISGKVRFDVETIGMDIEVVLRKLGIKENNYTLMGYSLGATVIVDRFANLTPRPGCILLMEPTPVFHYPKWSLLLIRFAVPLYPVLKPFAKWYLRNFQINTKEDREMALISSRALDQADPFKLKSTILSIANYTVWHRLGSVDCPVLIVATSKDKFHVHEEITRMTGSLKECGLIDMENNKRTHSAEMVMVIRNYINSLNKLPGGQPAFR